MPRKPGHYVYFLAYPNGTPFYVGKGNRNRMYNEIGRNRHCLEVIESIKHKKQNVRRSGVFKGSEEECYAVETALIKALGRRRGKSGILTNYAPGGKAPKLEPETRAKIKRTVKDRWEEGAYAERKSPGNTGMKFTRSAETRAKMSASAKARRRKV